MVTADEIATVSIFEILSPMEREPSARLDGP
jgi:hypothetical protein